MAAISGCRILGFDYSLRSTPNTHTKIKAPFSSALCSQFSKPNFGLNCTASTFPRLRISSQRNKVLERCLPRISCLLEDSCEDYSEADKSSVSNKSQQEAAIDLKLPRRSLLVTFTCDACGSRTQRLINRLAYERGLVYVQCAGCSRYHKLVDNLGLVIEYNLQGETDLDASSDQV